MKKRWVGWLGVLVALSSVPAEGTYVQPVPLPADRLIRNARARIEKDPGNANAHYTLARIYYRVFANRMLWVEAFESSRDEVQVASDSIIHRKIGPEVIERMAREQALREFGWLSQEEFQNDQRIDSNNRAFHQRYYEIIKGLEELDFDDRTLPVEKTLEFALLSLNAFGRAIKRDNGNPKYHLGLASLLDQIREYARTPEVPVGSREILLSRIPESVVLEAYLRTWELAFRIEKEYEMIGPDNLSQLISYEAGTAVLRILEGAQSPPPGESAEMADRIREGIKVLASKPQGAITPIVFSLSSRSILADFTESGVRVSFDIDGNGIQETLPWLSPDGGFLVWDQATPGQVRDGTQLFGSFTFGIHWSDGYAALESLDDDHDGWLSGPELEDLAFWTDANVNARSDPGEVRPLAELGVRRISVRPDGLDGGFPYCREGVTLGDGTSRTTWDWMFPMGTSE